MSLAERTGLVLACARTLYVNGQSTAQTLAAARRLGDCLGLCATIIPRWGEITIEAEDKDARLISQVTADPTNVNMNRVVSTMSMIEEVNAGRLAPNAAMQAIDAISRAPPARSALACTTPAP